MPPRETSLSVIRTHMTNTQFRPNRLVTIDRFYSGCIFFFHPFSHSEGHDRLTKMKQQRQKSHNLLAKAISVCFLFCQCYYIIYFGPISRSIWENLCSLDMQSVSSNAAIKLKHGMTMWRHRGYPCLQNEINKMSMPSQCREIEMDYL